MVKATLRELDEWFREDGLSADRTKLLSKLATIELCGWIEGEFDSMIKTVADGRISEPKWVEDNVIHKTYGFHYHKHWRGMLCKVVGEVFARRTEYAMEANSPGDLGQLKSLLGKLWIERCSFAHADIATNMLTATNFDAPSVTLNHYETLQRILSNYKVSMMSVMPSVTSE